MYIFKSVIIVVLHLDKPAKKNNVGGQTSNPSAVKPLRKIAPSSSSSSSATKIPLRRNSNSKLSPASGVVADELRTAVMLPSAKSTSNSVNSQRSVSRVHSTAVGCGSGSPLTLINAHKPSITSKSG